MKKGNVAYRAPFLHSAFFILNFYTRSGWERRRTESQSRMKLATR